MSAPAPPVSLAFQNAAIYANTLYAFQPNAFQSIDLGQGAQWKQLPMGISVNGSQSIIAQSDGQDALFIIGGRSNSSESNYPGFQKFVFSSNSWEALQPETSVAQNRVQHGAAYLNSTNSVLIFGGSQDNSYSATSQTYTITTSDPYTMKSYPGGAPAVQNPILMPLNASHALLAGGGVNQDEIWTFSEADGWVMMTTTIPGGVGDSSKVQGAVVNNGQSMQLELFDMSVSPNNVKTVSLSNQYHKREATEPSSLVRREGSAPTATRSGFSLAQSSDKVVLCGGTDDQSAGPMVIYDQTSNSWMNNQVVFGNTPTDSIASPASSGAASTASQAPSASGAATSASASASGSAASASSSDTADAPIATQTIGAGAPPNSNSSGSKGPDATTIILAAVLGSFFGIAALFLIALLVVRYRRNKAKLEMEREAIDADEKRAISPSSSFGASGKKSPFPRGQIPAISKPTLLPRNQADDLNSPRALGTDEGWSRYFANNNTVENLYPGTVASSIGGAQGSVMGPGHHGEHARYTLSGEYSHGQSSNLNNHDVYGHTRGVSRDTVEEEPGTYFASSSDEQDSWDPTSHQQHGYPHHNPDYRPASSIYQDSASIYPPHPLATGGGNGNNNNNNGVREDGWPAEFERVHEPSTQQQAQSGADKGMRSIIHRNFARDNVVSVASDDSFMPFPESSARRVSPGSLPRSAGNGSGRGTSANAPGRQRAVSGASDLSWLRIDQR